VLVAAVVAELDPKSSVEENRLTVVVSYKVYTLRLCVTVCDPINPVVNPIPVLYSRHTIRATI
jgi:hypothetical protein